MMIDKILSAEEKLNQLISSYEHYYAVFSGDFDHIYQEMYQIPIETRVPVMQVMLKAIKHNANPEYIYECLMQIINKNKHLNEKIIEITGDKLISVYNTVIERFSSVSFYFLEMVVLENRLNQLNRHNYQAIFEQIDQDLQKLDDFIRENSLEAVSNENILILKQFILVELLGRKQV